MFDLGNVQSENTGYKPLTAGLTVPAILESVEFAVDRDKNPTTDIVFNFKGTVPGNMGNLNFRIFANTFDSSAEKYNPTIAEYVLAQIKHILRAYVSEEVVLKVKDLATIVKVLNPSITKVPCELKVIYDKKNRPTFPLFPDFIRTKNTPERVFKANPKYDNFELVKLEEQPKGDMVTDNVPNLGGAPLDLSMLPPVDPNAPAANPLDMSF